MSEKVMWTHRRWQLHCLLFTILGLAVSGEAFAQQRDLSGDLILSEIQDFNSKERGAAFFLSLTEFAVRRAIELNGPPTALGNEIRQANKVVLRLPEQSELVAGADDVLPDATTSPFVEDETLMSNLRHLLELAPDIRILGGKRSNHAAIGMLTDDRAERVYCSATLIGPRTVLSVAHCFCGRKQNGDLDRPTRIVFGSTRIGSHERQPAILLLESLQLRSQCRSNEGWIEDAETGDLALVRINKSLPVAASKVRLAHPEDFQEARLAALVGYGKLGWAEETSPEQQWFAIVPIGSADCSRPGDQRNYGCHPPQEGQPIEMVTLDRLDGKHRDALHGDSGGPLILATHDAADLPRNPLIVAGVMSRKAEARAGGIRGEISVLLTNKNIVAWIESYGRS